MTREHACDRLLARIPEIVDFTPHFPNIAIVVPHNTFRPTFSRALKQAYLDAGQRLLFSNMGSIGGWDFMAGIFAISSSALRGRTLDTLYVPDRADLSPRQYSDYDYMMATMHPTINSMQYSRVYVY